MTYSSGEDLDEDLVGSEGWNGYSLCDGFPNRWLESVGNHGLGWRGDGRRHTASQSGGGRGGLARTSAEPIICFVINCRSGSRTVYGDIVCDPSMLVTDFLRTADVVESDKNGMEDAYSDKCVAR